MEEADSKINRLRSEIDALEDEVRFFTRQPWAVNISEIKERDPEVFIIAQHFAYKILNRAFNEIDNKTEVIESFKQKRPILKTRLTRMDNDIREIENFELLMHIHNKVIHDSTRAMCEEIVRELTSSLIRVT